MALEIVGGAAIGTVFAALYDIVKISLGKTVMQFKPLLRDLKFTLDSLKPRIIQQIGEHNLALGLPNDEIESLQQQMEEGVKLVCKLSKLSRWSCQIWCSCCNCGSTSYTDKLVELDRSLRILLEILKLQEARDVKEALLLARKIHEKQDDLDKRLADLLKVQHEAGDRMRVQQERNAPESSGSNRQKTMQDQNQGNGVEGATLRAMFKVLFDAVIQVKDKNKVFKRILGYLKSTLDYLKPLIEEIGKDNRALHLSKKELENFKIQMEKGVELVQNCSKVHQWESYKKYDCTNKLLGLDESLQRLLYILRVQLARDVRESLVSINEVETVIKKIEERNVEQNDQIVSKASYPIPESPSATVGSDALNVEGTQEMMKEILVGSRKIEEAIERMEGSDVMKNQIEIKDSCEAVQPQGINDVIETLDSTMDVEAGLKKIKGTKVVQNQVNIAVSEPQSPTIALDVIDMEAIEVVEALPLVPEYKLPSSTHALDVQFGFIGLTGNSKKKRQEMDKEQDKFTSFPMQPSDSAIQPEMWGGSSNIFSMEGSVKAQQQQTQDSNSSDGVLRGESVIDLHDLPPAKGHSSDQRDRGDSSDSSDVVVGGEPVIDLHELPLAKGHSSDQNPGGDSSETSSLIHRLGRDISINCLLRCSRSDYGSIALLNKNFRSLIRSGELYRLRRQMGIVEHWVYLSCNLSEWEAFDPNRGRWMNLPRMSSNECFMCSDKESLAVGTELLVFGKDIMARVIYRYSILTNTWSSGTEMNTPRCLFASGSLGEIAIVAGGCDPRGNILDSAELYNSETGMWSTLPSMKKARKMHSGVFMDGKFYVVGGVEIGDPKQRTCGEVYDLQKGTWTEIPNMFPGAGVVEAPPLLAVVNNTLYAADHAEQEVRRYDKEKNVWLSVGRLPERAVSMNGWGLAFRACGDRLIVIALCGGTIELNSWVPDQDPPQWNLLARKPSGSFVYNSAVMGC